jgi:hypothetical protein
MEVTTVFKVRTTDKTGTYTEFFEVKAIDQEAVNTLRKQAGAKASIILDGFKVDGIFHKVDLNGFQKATGFINGK